MDCCVTSGPIPSPNITAMLNRRLPVPSWGNLDASVCLSSVIINLWFQKFLLDTDSNRSSATHEFSHQKERQRSLLGIGRLIAEGLLPALLFLYQQFLKTPGTKHQYRCG